MLNPFRVMIEFVTPSSMVLRRNQGLEAGNLSTTTWLKAVARQSDSSAFHIVVVKQ